MLKRFASNAGANVFSGAVAAAYQLAVTGMAISTWQGAAFASWALAMSIAAIAPILSANLSSVVTRRVVEARHGDPEATETAIVLAGRRIGLGLASVAVGILFSAGAWIQPRSGSGALTMADFLVLLLVLLSTHSWLLLWQTRFGQHYADERNWLPALTQAFARLSGMMGMSAVLATGSENPIAVALGLCAGTWAGLGAAQLGLPRPRTLGSAGVQPVAQEIREQLRGNLRVLSGFAVGAASTLIIQYSIPPLIALIEPDRFNAFYVASTLNNVAVGALAAAMSALLAPFARWHASGYAPAMQRVALFSPALCAGSCLAVLCVCWFSMQFILNALAPRSAHTEDIRLFLALLGLQAIVRNAAAGFATYVSSAGSLRQIGTPLVIEMVLAFAVATPLGLLYGVHALLLGLTFSGLIGSLYSSKMLTSLHARARISTGTAFASLLAAQVAGSALWWWITRVSP